MDDSAHLPFAVKKKKKHTVSKARGPAHPSPNRITPASPGGPAADIYNKSLWTRVVYLTNQGAPSAGQLQVNTSSARPAKTKKIKKKTDSQNKSLGETGASCQPASQPALDHSLGVIGTLTTIQARCLEQLGPRRGEGAEAFRSIRTHYLLPSVPVRSVPAARPR